RIAGVVVSELLDPSTAQGCAGDETRVTELVHDDDVARPGKHRKDADVREIPAAEHDRLRARLELGETLLELAVERMVAGDESGRAGARAVAARCVDARFDDARITREAEVVVARERDELPGSA